MDAPRPPIAAPTAAAERAPASPAAQAAAAVVLALARAVRSLGLYDPGNAVVRQALAEYRDRARDALAVHGALAIEVRPFELAVGGEVVYREPDRERSLAFRLFRDGVRKLTLHPTVSWDELLHLLRVLAVRATALRQQEEDVVTALREVELAGITLEAVEGFTPAEENPEPALDDAARRAARAKPPAGWDTPLPRLPQPGPLAFRAVPEEATAALRAAAGDGEHVADLALSVARDLLVEAVRSGWPVPNPDLVAFFAELRDVLLADAELGSLRRLLDLVSDTGASALREATLRGLGDARTLDLVLASVPDDASQLPPELVPFLPLLGIEAALDRLLPGADTPEARRRLLLRIVTARLPREADAVLARLPALDPRVARELVRAVAARAPERGSEVARYLLRQPDPVLRVEALNALERGQGAFPLRAVCELLDDPAPAVRARAAEVLGRRGDASVLEALRAHLEGQREVGPEEAEALGRAMAHVAPIAAGRLFAGWIEPRVRFLRGRSAQQRALQWAAVAGEGELPGPEADRALTALAARTERVDPELRRHCLATLARRGKGEGHGPAGG